MEYAERIILLAESCESVWPNVKNLACSLTGSMAVLLARTLGKGEDVLGVEPGHVDGFIAGKTSRYIERDTVSGPD